MTKQISLIFFFLLLGIKVSAQKIDSLDLDGDGILNSEDSCPNVKGIKDFNGCPDPRPDCTNFQIEKKVLFDKFKKEALNVVFSNLQDIIFSEINFKKLNKKNIILSPINAKGYVCGVPFMYKCSSNYNIINPNFSADDFLNIEILEKLKKKLKANIIPCVSINNFDTEWGLDFYETKYKNYFSEYKLNNLDKIIQNNFSFAKINDKNQESNIYFFSFQNQKLNISDANYLMFDFKNELENIVIVDIYYNKEETPQIIKFQYKNQKWQKI